MNSIENYVVYDSDIEKMRIEEIDLGMVARYFRIIDRFLSSENIAATHEENHDEGSHIPSTRSRLVDFLTSNRLYYAERQIALRMIFNSILAAPKHIAQIERLFGIRLTENEEYTGEDERQHHTETGSTVKRG